jgi:hypothetical protein
VGCGDTADTLHLFHDRQSAPGAQDQADQTKTVGSNCSTEQSPFKVTWANAPDGLYQSWLRFGGVLGGVVRGPIEVCIGPDLVLESFSLEKDGANLTYVVKLCNRGSKDAQKFRVGFWHDNSGAPASSDMGHVFKGIKLLQAGKCYDENGDGKEDMLRVGGGLQPNGDFVAWARVDSGEFVGECREGNNTPASIAYKMRNPDLYVKDFSFKVSGSTVTYTVEVCNQGAADVPKFFVDVYYNRPKRAPSFGEPGDEAIPVLNLAQKQCTTVTFTRNGAADGDYVSYAIVDPDDFISEPDEGNNFSGAIAVKVGQGGTGPGPGPQTDCVDRDGDGHGVGPGCSGVPDCNDNDASIHFGAKESCGDNIDQDCDLTIDDGCPGVDCVDNDGDGFGVGKDCVIEDYNDNDPNVYPWAPPETQGTGKTCVDQDGDGWGVGPGCPGVPDCNDRDAKQHPGVGKEACGDNIDNDCDLTVDDGCPDVDCKDSDGDGWGVGADCVIPDPDDNNPDVHPYAQCTDKDKDGYGVGRGCKGPPDCDDNDANVHPGAKEDCGDNVDNDCDLTVNDGCPGVDCKDSDGDGWGVGADCVLADCDDTNKNVFPFARETCGDNVDDNCNKIADDGCQGRQCVDRDGDGYGVGLGCPGPQDCDDGNFTVNPGAAEICGDGIDNDCDNVPEDGCKDSNIDRDGDGVGVGGGVDGQPDCNDSDPKIGPNQKEVCGDGIDNDCDGTVDDGCAGVDCKDGDGDGWGVGADCQIKDCDDKNKDVFPFAKEVCGDGIDNDCDGTVDDGCPGVDCNDSDGDGWGVGADCVVADCDDNDGGTNAWAAEICSDNKDNNCDGSIDEGCVVCQDRDGDGHGIGPRCTSWDCNDKNAQVFPGAAETCDLLDNNCDGVVPAEETDCALAKDGCSIGGASSGGSWPITLLLGMFWMGIGRRKRRATLKDYQPPNRLSVGARKRLARRPRKDTRPPTRGLAPPPKAPTRLR